MKNNSRQLIAGYYTAHIDELRCFIRERIGARGCSEDIAQDVFVRLLSGDKMITEVTLPCLVYTTARNLIIDHWRRCRTMERYEHEIKVAMAYKYGQADVVSVYSAKEITEQIERCLARMPEDSACAYRLHLYEGMKVSEISERMNIRYKIAEHRLGQARRLVRLVVSDMNRVRLLAGEADGEGLRNSGCGLRRTV